MMSASVCRDGARRGEGRMDRKVKINSDQPLGGLLENPVDITTRLIQDSCRD